MVKQNIYKGIVFGMLALLMLASITDSPSANQDPTVITFPTSTLSVMVTISDRLVVQHKLKVEVASTPKQRARGLMFRKELAADSGMLFLFDRSEIQKMWMKNTAIPLDMLFIAPDGTVVDVVTNAEPFSEEVIASRASASAVLEMNAGAVMRAGIHAGDRVEHEAFAEK